MVNSGTLETGVDKLLSLVREKKRISMKEAATILNVSQGLLKQWVEILEEEGVISLDYLFTMPYIVERKQTKEEEKKFTPGTILKQKDLFVKQAETMQITLEKESITIDKLKNEFDAIKKEMGPDLQHFTHDLKNFDELNEVKDQIISEFKGVHQEYLEKIKEIECELKAENKSLNDIKTEMLNSDSQITEEMLNLSNFKNNINLKKEINEIEKDIETTRIKIENEKQIIKKAFGNKKELSPKIKEITRDIGFKNREITNLLKKAKKVDFQMKQKEQEIRDKVKNVKKKMKVNLMSNDSLAKRFIEFLEKKQEVGILIETLYIDKEKLKKDLQELIREAKFVKPKDQIEHAKNLNSKMRSIEEKRKWFRSRMQKLVDLLK